MHPCQPLPWPQPRPSTQLASKARRNNSTTHPSVSSARAFPHTICPPTDRTPRGPEAVILHTGNPGPERSRDRSKVALPQIKTLPPVTTQPPQHTVPKCWTQKEKGKLGQEILFTPGPRFLSGQSARWACILRGESNVWRNHYALLTWRVCRGLAPVLLDPEVEDPQRELSARPSASPKSLRPSRPCWSDTDLAFLALLPALPSHHQPQIPVQNTFTISADELQRPISPPVTDPPRPPAPLLLSRLPIHPGTCAHARTGSLLPEAELSRWRGPELWGLCGVVCCLYSQVPAAAEPALGMR